MEQKTITITSPEQIPYIDFNGVTEVVVILPNGLSGPGQALDLGIKIWGMIGNDKVPIKINCSRDEQNKWATQFGLIPIKEEKTNQAQAQL